MVDNHCRSMYGCIVIYGYYYWCAIILKYGRILNVYYMIVLYITYLSSGYIDFLKQVSKLHTLKPASVRLKWIMYNFAFRPGYERIYNDNNNERKDHHYLLCFI